MNRKFIIGPTADTDKAERMRHAQARELARGQPGNGYVWMLVNRHWHIVANYSDGSVWNASAKCVPCKPDPCEDWEFFGVQHG